MENQRRYNTPQYLNEPYRLIIFTVDEVFVAVMTIYLLGSVCGFIVSSLVIASALIYFMKRMKGNEGPYYYVHLFYWFFGISPKLRATPPSWIREFLG